MWYWGDDRIETTPGYCFNTWHRESAYVVVRPMQTAVCTANEELNGAELGQLKKPRVQL
jgi:hypothetical protein